VNWGQRFGQGSVGLALEFFRKLPEARTAYGIWLRGKTGTKNLCDTVFRMGEVRREITAQELGALLSGIDLSQAQRSKRYRRKHTQAA
jgi:hypothetical protein